MKRLLIAVFILLNFINVFCSCETLAQTRDQKTETFIKFWGFLKYHHPGVAAGRQDWDSVYIANIDVVRNSKNKKDFNDILLSITTQLGPVSTPQAKKPADSLFAKNSGDGALQSSPFLNESMKIRLKEIYDHRNQGPNRYIRLQNMTADYSGEKLYEDMGFPDYKYRLLFLARFYNAINYFAPYKHLTGQDWNIVLRKAIPEIIAANDTLSYYKVLTKLAVSLNDGHAQISSSMNYNAIKDKLFGKYTAPFYSAIAEGKVVITKLASDSLCRKAGIRKGDIIAEVDGERVEDRIKRRSSYVSASNESSRMHYLSWVLFDTPHKTQKLRVKRQGKLIDMDIRCILTAEKNWADITGYTSNDTGYKTIGSDIAYVYAMQIHDKNAVKIKELIQSKKAVIFDVRNYPNNDAFYSIFDMFLPEAKPINYSLVSAPGNPGYFQWQLSPKLGGPNKNTYKGKVVILADERSQSQGEYSVMTIQTIPGAVTVGRQTAGADGLVTQVPVGGRLFISYSGYGVYYPDKSGTQRSGVKIDKAVEHRLADLQKGRDAVLEEALHYLKQNGIE